MSRSQAGKEGGGRLRGGRVSPEPAARAATGAQREGSVALCCLRGLGLPRAVKLKPTAPARQPSRSQTICVTRVSPELHIPQITQVIKHCFIFQMAQSHF